MDCQDCVACSVVIIERFVDIDAASQNAIACFLLLPQAGANGALSE